jgi:hypothetical protein
MHSVFDIFAVFAENQIGIAFEQRLDFFGSVALFVGDYWDFSGFREAFS